MNKPRIIGVRVPVAMYQNLEAIAARENNNVSSVVRRLLTEAVKRELGSHGTLSQLGERLIRNG